MRLYAYNSLLSVKLNFEVCSYITKIQKYFFEVGMLVSNIISKILNYQKIKNNLS